MYMVELMLTGWTEMKKVFEKYHIDDDVISSIRKIYAVIWSRWIFASNSVANIKKIISILECVCSFADIDLSKGDCDDG